MDDPTIPPESAPPRLVERLLRIRPGEGWALLLAGGYFFFLMLGYYMLRPLREAMGIARGADKLPWLMTATLALMLVANPAFAALVSRLPRRRFIPWAYRFFAVNLLLFFGFFRWSSSHGGAALGYAFYVWLSVFNLFVVSVFWGFMADLFTEEQGKRLFGIVAIGGTLGAISGAGVTDLLTRSFHLGPGWLMLIAACFLESAVQCEGALARGFHLGNKAQGPQEPGPGLLEGIRRISRSPYLALICGYILLFTLTTTLLYMAQGFIVAKSFTSQAARAVAFARIDFWVNVLTLFTQLFLTSRLITRFGVRPILMVLPMLTVVGFGAVWIWPTFAVLAGFQVLRRGLHYAVDRPAREVLYIPLGPEEKYKSKPFIDTFVYRGGDFLGAWAPAALNALTIPVAAVAVGLSLLWLKGAFSLGSLHRRMAED